MLTTGPLMLSAEPERGYGNPAFSFKMCCLLLALVTHFTIHHRATRTGPASAATLGEKLAACLSLVLWTGVIFGGQAIRVFLKAFKVSLFTFCQWIETTSISTAIREGALYYPILGAFHLAGIRWFGGMVLMSDLSVLGIGLPHAPVAEVLSHFRRWKWVGFVIVLLSGGLLWWSEPIVCYKSVSFRIKLALLALVGVNALFVRKEVYRSLAAGDLGVLKSRGARLGACISLFLWVALVFTGRGIAFF